MKIYFPQWQGSGKGTSIEHGAKTVLDYFNDGSIVEIPLSTIPTGNKEYNINNFNALVDQLSHLKDCIERDDPDKIQTIGGDCGLEIVPVSYLNKKYPNLGVIWFDAHADINRPCDSPSCNFHGMPLRTLLGEGDPGMNNLLSSTIEASQIHYIGLRDIDEAEKIRIDQGNIYAPEESNVLQLVNILEEKSISHVYLHFDFDCLEPSEYDKTYYQVPNGLRIREAEAHIRKLMEHFTVVGSSVLESISRNTKELQPIENIITLLMK